MFNSDGQRKEFPVKGGTLTVGRKNTCGLRIPLSSVSREHFRIEQQEDETLLLRDLGSSNGTFYNGDRVQEAELNPGDQIKVGPVTFIVVVDGKPTEIEPIRTVLPSEKGQAAAEVQAGQPEAAASDESAAPAAEAAADASDASATPAPAVTEQPEAIESSGEMPAQVDEESHSPTVDFDEEDDDDDPIAALEALAASTGDDDDDEPIPFIDDEDEDEEEQSSSRQRSQ